jgi:HSP20 family protein
MRLLTRIPLKVAEGTEQQSATVDETMTGVSRVKNVNAKGGMTMYFDLNTNRIAANDCCSTPTLTNLFPFRMDAMLRAAGRSGRLPATDIREDASRYVILMNMPGVAKERVTITAEDNGLTVRTSEEEKKDGDTLKTVYRERMAGTYEREFHFDEPVDVENVTARIENGVLELTVPKKAQSTDTKTIPVS